MEPFCGFSASRRDDSVMEQGPDGKVVLEVFVTGNNRARISCAFVRLVRYASLSMSSFCNSSLIVALSKAMTTTVSQEAGRGEKGNSRQPHKSRLWWEARGSLLYSLVHQNGLYPGAVAEIAAASLGNHFTKLHQGLRLLVKAKRDLMDIHTGRFR